MILTKYRMITENGYIETLDRQEAHLWQGTFEIVTEEIPDEVTND